jgi:hypothetical protein
MKFNVGSYLECKHARTLGCKNHLKQGQKWKGEITIFKWKEEEKVLREYNRGSEVAQAPLFTFMKF